MLPEALLCMARLIPQRSDVALQLKPIGVSQQPLATLGGTTGMLGARRGSQAFPGHPQAAATTTASRS
ncbi:hypothetical protein THAOC_29803, partial [Thalassiosira oceanica]